MIVGVPKEIKDNERRVALTPFGARTLAQAGHSVVIETGAGVGSGFGDDEYIAAGARVEGAAAAVWASPMVLKVKEPLSEEYTLLHEDLLLFTFLHLAPEVELTGHLLAKKVTGIAYETVRGPDGRLPILEPMSEVAGRMAAQVAAHLLTHMGGGRGLLLGGVPGVAPARVVILGAGTVGSHAAQVAVGMGAQVTVLNRGLEALRRLALALDGRIVTVAASGPAIADAVRNADVLIGAVLVPGARAPRLVTEDMVRTMGSGAVIVDVAIDQGGCIETIKPTSHSQPTYVRHGVVHYAVPNIPGAVPRTSTMALCNATLPYALQLAGQGFEQAVGQSPALAAGVNTFGGAVTNQAVAEAQGREFVPLASLLHRRQ